MIIDETTFSDQSMTKSWSVHGSDCGRILIHLFVLTILVYVAALYFIKHTYIFVLYVLSYCVVSCLQPTWKQDGGQTPPAGDPAAWCDFIV